MPECNIGGELARLRALRRYNILDTAPEEAFDRITRLVKSVLQMPMVTVSLIDENRQWFKSQQGMKIEQTPRNVSFCTHTIQDTKPFIVTDALTDPRFASSPLVTGEPYIRYYIGMPLRSRDGYNVGALCSMDTKVRHLTEVQIKILEDLAKLVVDELELRLLASNDGLTNALTRKAFFDQANREIARAKRHGHPLSCALIDLDHFKSINDSGGHGAGDLVLQNVVALIKSQLRESDFIGRIGGEEFAVMLPETEVQTALDVAERLRRSIEASVVELDGKTITATASIGVAEFTGVENNAELLLQRADIAMYDAKSAGRNRVVGYAKGHLKAVCETLEEPQRLMANAR